jgi:KDEL-tailed cysteine endopeptidase
MANAVAIVALMCAIVVLLPPPAGSVRFQFEEEDMATEEAMSALYQRWAAHHRVARNVAETARRFDIFKDKVRRIHAFNKQGNAPFFLGLNQFGDMTEAEVDKTYGDCSTSIAYESDGAWPTGPAPTDASRVLILPPPEQVDWRQKGVVTAVKNQGPCQACWAFAAIAAVESLNAIKTGQLYDLSEQAVVDCADPPNEGCEGGLAAEALRFMSMQGRQNGAFSEDAYPYRYVRKFLNFVFRLDPNFPLKIHGNNLKKYCNM